VRGPHVLVLLLVLVAVQLCGQHPLMYKATNYMFTHAANILGPGHASMAGPFELNVAGWAYQVVFWCTPTMLASIGILLLWLRCRSLVCFVALTPAVLCAAMLAMVLNFVVSVWLRETGIDWSLAHKPGLYLLYLTTAIATGIAIADRNSATNQRHDPSSSDKSYTSNTTVADENSVQSVLPLQRPGRMC